MGISKTNLKWINKSGETQDLEERLNELELGLDKVESDYLSRSEGGSVEGDLTADSFTLSASGDTYSGFKFYAEGDNVYVAKQKSEGDPEVELIALKTDDELSAESTNPIQNKVVNEVIEELSSSEALSEAKENLGQLTSEVKKLNGEFLSCRTQRLTPSLKSLIGLLGSKVNRLVNRFGQVTAESWSSVSFSGDLTQFVGSDIWTDGTNIYHSSTTRGNYVLDLETLTWSAKTWNGLTSLNTGNIWTDGTNIYYSTTDSYYLLDVETSTWTRMTWSGIEFFHGYYIWTDGKNIYSSGDNGNYVLDKETRTWSVKTWNGITGTFYGEAVWSDGTNIYYSSGTSQYVLDVETSTWSAKTWNGLTSFSGAYIWTDGTNIYYSNNTEQYVLDVETSTWSAKTWGISIYRGDYVWSDGTNIHYSRNSYQYVLKYNLSYS